jgi:hypothetical protein
VKHFPLLLLLICGCSHTIQSPIVEHAQDHCETHEGLIKFEAGPPGFLRGGAAVCSHINAYCADGTILFYDTCSDPWSVK